IAEHPFDGSWGYQVCGYYAPTSRFGSPEDFMYFVNKLHSKGIGVILDWVPAHFPKDEHGLYEFDGSPLYEYSDPTRMENKGWGTRCFDVGRNEIRSFLISNACFWLDKYHIDGLRIDAVASMLYLDYDRKAGEWHPNVHGGNHNLEAISFFQHLNKVVYDNFPDRMMIAEESTAYPDVTKRHGLGFTFKWNMGWMNDTLSYLPVDPYFRSGSHGKLTFAMMYNFAENYVLPLSHDEVVHCKHSIIGRCSGDYWQQFATLRAYFAYMMAHPGKKLSFMGNEIAQFAEWDYKGQIDWFLLEYEKHRQFKDYMRALNGVYKDTPALWDLDRDWGGFNWVDADARDENMLIFSRLSKYGERVYAIINFSASPHDNRTFAVESGGYYSVLLNSDSPEFGGCGYMKKKTLRAVKDGNGGYKITVSVPPLGALYIKKRSGQKK
ncbi:MAG: 1,4-alpha-glucan branching protein GlgB, partial [Clostridia bacterium]|nr:1,4-alpha-glucan branching protein GlgB [Clostridia bacterium]